MFKAALMSVLAFTALPGYSQESENTQNPVVYLEHKKGLQFDMHVQGLPSPLNIRLRGNKVEVKTSLVEFSPHNRIDLRFRQTSKGSATTVSYSRAF